MEAKHTATPWSFKECDSDPTLYQILDSAGRVIGFARRGTGSNVEKKEFAANADLIVRACNAHAALVESANAALDALTDERADAEFKAQAASMLRAALAAAGAA